ncbi:MAG: cohesin domain-containing protein [Patescibacteria group bacterium]
MRGLKAAEKNPQVYFQTAASSFDVDEKIVIGVFVNSKTPVNAFRIEIGYPPSILDFSGYNAGNSIIEFWHGDPAASEGGVIKLEGGAQNPFSGEAGEIIKLNFKAKRKGLAEMSFRTVNIYYADGLGTLAETEALPLKVSATLENLQRETDKIPPRILDLEIAKSPADNSKMVVFRAVDKETGLKATYLRARKWFSWGVWQQATNPVRLTAGVWTFQLRAVDNEGNTAAQTFYVKQAIVEKIFYLILVFGTVYALYDLFNNRRKKKLL